MTVLDGSLALLAAALAWEWRVARQDCRAALDVADQAMGTLAEMRGRLAALQVWR